MKEALPFWWDEGISNHEMRVPDSFDQPVHQPDHYKDECDKGEQSQKAAETFEKRGDRFNHAEIENESGQCESLYPSEDGIEIDEETGDTQRSGDDCRNEDRFCCRKEPGCGGALRETMNESLEHSSRYAVVRIPGEGGEELFVRPQP